jgi:hypothetical protein
VLYKAAIFALMIVPLLCTDMYDHISPTTPVIRQLIDFVGYFKNHTFWFLSIISNG